MLVQITGGNARSRGIPKSRNEKHYCQKTVSSSAKGVRSAATLKKACFCILRVLPVMMTERVVVEDRKLFLNMDAAEHSLCSSLCLELYYCYTEAITRLRKTVYSDCCRERIYPARNSDLLLSLHTPTSYTTNSICLPHLSGVSDSLNFHLLLLLLWTKYNLSISSRSVSCS